MTPRTPRGPRARGAAAKHGLSRPGRNRQRQRLIDACISALHIHGPSRTTVEKVVAIAKMSPGIVRFYFDSKAAMLVASLQFLAAEFEEQVLAPVARLKSSPVAALELMVDLYLDPEIASPRKVSVWYAFWGEASSRQEYYDICGQKDESFAALVRELVEAMIVATSRPELDPDGVALGLIGALEMMWQEFAFRTEQDIDRAAARNRCLAYLRSVFPGQFRGTGMQLPPAAGGAHGRRRLGCWVYEHPQLLARERELLFAASWAFVGHESELSRPREFLTVDTGAERALVVRNERGRFNVFRNSCPDSPHALVRARRGTFEQDIECRAHRLRFSIDGTPPAALPTVESPRAELPRLASLVVGGLIFARSPEVWRDASPATPPELDSPPQGLMALRLPREAAVAADWKIVVEQWLHSAPGDVTASFGANAFEWHPGIEADSGWSAQRYRRLMAGAPAEGAAVRWGRRFLPPNQLFETRPDGISVVQVLPVSAGRCIVRRSDYSILPPDDAARAVLFLAGRLGPSARATPVELAGSVQAGMTEFAYAAGAGTQGSAAVGWFHEWLAARIPAIFLDRPANEP